MELTLILAPTLSLTLRITHTDGKLDETELKVFCDHLPDPNADTTVLQTKSEDTARKDPAKKSEKAKQVIKSEKAKQFMKQAKEVGQWIPHVNAQARTHQDDALNKPTLTPHAH